VRLSGEAGAGSIGRWPKRRNSDKDRIVVEKLKELRLAHPFWGYSRMTAWLNHRDGLSVNRKRIYRSMRENGLVVEQVRHKALRVSQRAKLKYNDPSFFTCKKRDMVL